MKIDPDQVALLAEGMGADESDSLAELLLALLELEHSTRHKKRPRLVRAYEEMIDEEGRDEDG